jgi:rhodanese-related sulfurtransferase
VTPEIDPHAFGAAHAAGAFVIDVREAYEYVAGHVAGALLMPLGQVHSRLDEIPKNAPVYVICASGNRSKTAASWMRNAGIDAASVSGGTSAWAAVGRPLVRGPRTNESAA